MEKFSNWKILDFIIVGRTMNEGFWNVNFVKNYAD